MRRSRGEEESRGGEEKGRQEVGRRGSYDRRREGHDVCRGREDKGRR